MASNLKQNENVHLHPNQNQATIEMKNGIASVRCRFNYLSDKHKDQRFQILITPSMVTNNGK